MPSFVHGGLAALVVMAGVGGATLVRAQTDRDLTTVQTDAYRAGQAKPSSLSIVTLLDRADATYAIGESMRLAVKANEDAYVTVLNIGASGRVTQLFPNRFQADNRIKAGEMMEVPSAASGASIRVSGPVGAELIKVIASSKPLALIPREQLQLGSGPFGTLDGGILVLKRDLEVVSSNPPPETKLAIVNQVIRTVPVRAGGAVASGVLVVPLTEPSQDAAILPVVVGVPAQGFPLLLATDKTRYKVGEPITMAVTSLQACHLHVIERDGTGRARLLFPSATLPSNQIGALQTMMISGGPSPQTVVAKAAGSESIAAFCTGEGRTALPLRSATEDMSEDDKTALDRDLALVTSHPTPTDGFAQIALTITP